MGVSIGRRIVLAVPLLWLAVFFLAPFAVIAVISLSEPAISIPPYKPVFSWDGGERLSLSLNFGNHMFLYKDALYASAYLSSAEIAFGTTILCLLAGYPIAYFIARSRPVLRNILLLLVILPFWTSFLLRVYALIGLLKNNGVINNILLKLGIITEPIAMLHSNFAVYVGTVYTYLPFMILPLYANLVKLDLDLLEASADLGASPTSTFFHVTLPLSLPGIIAGSMLVFIPVIGEFIIPALLGGPDTLMIGKVLWNEFFANRDWPVASAVAIAMLVLLVAPIMILRGLKPAARGV